MRTSRSFLIVCEEAEKLALLANALHAVFPHSIVQTCRDSESAVQAAGREVFDAMVACRATDADLIPVVEVLRRVTPAPLMAIGGLDEREKCAAAGASHFLEADRWLLAGRVVAEMIGENVVDV